MTDTGSVGAMQICRDCGEVWQSSVPAGRCRKCGSPRVLSHPELASLSIAHVDCDAFYASIEKRDDPSIRDKPVIVGGSTRGVVSTCCYIARQYGVRSAMPSFTAKRLCPDAVFISPDMEKYVVASKQIRALMDALTPDVEPLSIDEAFLDLSGTATAHRASPAEVLARFARLVENEVGVTVSIGLSHNKFLAKIASDLDKPRGFAVIGKAETVSFLAEKPISVIFGVGKVFTETLRKDGLVTIGQLQTMSANDLSARYGEMGARLSRLSRGEDKRSIHSDASERTISTETTFGTDLTDFDKLSQRLFGLCERLSDRLKAKSVVGDTITLKLKSAGFRLRTRSRQLGIPTQLVHTIYANAEQLLAREVDGTAFRLIGIGVSGLAAANGDDPADLVEPGIARKAAAERAVDKLRGRFGREAVVRGKLYRGERASKTKDEQS